MSVELKKHTLNLRDGDWDYISRLTQGSNLNTSDVIRTLVSAFVDRKRKEEGSQEINVEINI